MQITTTSTHSDMDIIVSDLQDLAVNQRINLIGKVIDVLPPMKIQSTNGSKLLKQDCTLGDSSGACRAVLWEDQVSCLEIDNSYNFKNANVRQFNNMKYVSLSEKSEIEKVGDIGEVNDAFVEDEQSLPCHVIKGEIVNVVQV